MAVSSEAIDVILSHYFQHGHPWEVRTGKSGYNNTTRYIKAANQQYILRIYETHKDESKVKFEHGVLIKLSALKLPFQNPTPVVSGNGNTLLRLQDGTDRIACLYQCIEGTNPAMDRDEEIKSFGVRSGQLLEAMKQVKLEQPFVYRPYYEIEHAHPNCPLYRVVEWCSNPPDEFINYQNELAKIATQLIHFQDSVGALKALPHQLIHGDLNGSNVLVNPNHSINAILDFEFATYDLRVMEVAVCIAELAVTENDNYNLAKKIHTYSSGLFSVITLTEEEMNALPLLILLRRMDVFVHFLGRYLDGIDQDNILKEQIKKASDNLYWLDSKGKQLLGLS